MKTLSVLSFFTFFSFYSASQYSRPEKVPVQVEGQTATDYRINRHKLGLAIGQSYLFGDYEDLGKKEIIPTLIYEYSASFLFDLHLGFQHGKFEKKDESISISALNIGLKGKTNFYDKLAPYLMGGIGLFIPKATRVSGNSKVDTPSKLVFGLHGAAGAELFLANNFSVGMYLQYQKPFNVEIDDQKDLSGSYGSLGFNFFYIF